MDLQNDSAGTETAWRRKLMFRLIPLVLVLIAGVLTLRLTTGQWLPREAPLHSLVAAQDFARHHGLLFLAVFIGAYTLAVALSAPVAVFFTIIGGFLFGWVPGALIAVFAKTVGSLFFFLVARFGFDDLASHHAGPKMAMIERYVSSDSFFYLLGLRLQPLIPFFMINIAAAFFEVRIRIFVLATAFGVAPGAFISSYAGVGVNDVLHANRALQEACLHGGVCDETLSLAALWSPKALFALVLLAILALMPVIGRRWLKLSPPSA